MSISFEKINNKLLFFGFISLLLDNVPTVIRLNFFSGGLADKGSWYFFAAFLLLCIYQKGKDRINFSTIEKGFIQYLLLLVAVTLISNIVGIIQYPYYDELLSGPKGQIEKLPIVLNFLNSHDIVISYQTLLSFWIGVRAIKGSILGIIFTFGISFAIYWFIKKKWNKYYSLLEKAVTVSLVIITVYSIIETAYLAGNPIAASILSFINPLLHPIAADHNWWPPLLWEGQLRSVFSEPSRMGNFAAFALPFLWSRFIDENKSVSWQTILLTLLFTFFIFLTKARTPIAIYWGMMAIFTLSGIFFRKRQFFKGAAIIAVITIVSFGGSIYFINHLMVLPDGNNQKKVSASEFINDNVGSLASSSKRSNGARYALIRSNLATGLEYPVFGVGSVLTSAYTVNNFNEYDLNNKEVSMWVNDYKTQGVMKYSLDGMNEYISQFAKHGFIGLLLFLLPGLYALVGLLRKLKVTHGAEQRKVYTVFLALIGTLVAGCNGSLTLLYTYWVVLAFAYAIIFEGENRGLFKVKS